MKISRADYNLIRTHAKSSLYFFEKYILGFKDLVPHVHGKLCAFIQRDDWPRKQVTMPRGFLKTSTCTIGKAIWLAVNDPNIRILIASNVVENASKMIGMIRNQFESNPRLRRFFPEVIPDSFNKNRWSDRCAEIKRPRKYQEGTWEAVGVGGSVISRHYDHIIEDDLIYAKKDDFTGGELMPSREDIEKAIGWHKLSTSLLIHPRKGRIDNIGTRWAPYDLISYINRNERGWRHWHIDIIDEDDKPMWPERFDQATIDSLRASQGPYIFSTQYLCRPIDSAMRVFQRNWLKPYDILPPYKNGELRFFTAVDLAGWEESHSRRKCYNVIITVAVDKDRHFYIVRYDRGRYNPTEVVERIWQHCRAYPVEKVGVEVVYYQKAILEEFKRFYEKTGNTIPVDAYKREGNITKDARIRGLQPICANGALYYLPPMREFIEEYEDYPMSRTVDILDALSDAIRIAQPPDVSEAVQTLDEYDIEAIVEKIKEGKGSGLYPINNDLQAEREFYIANPLNFTN